MDCQKCQDSLKAKLQELLKGRQVEVTSEKTAETGGRFEVTMTHQGKEEKIYSRESGGGLPDDVFKVDKIYRQIASKFCG